MIKLSRKVQLIRRPNRSRGLVTKDEAPARVAPGRVPRVSRLMALAIHFDRLIREGRVRDQSDLARLAHVTQPRMTQIMNLNHLAPDIQEELVFLTPVTEGRDPVTERDIRLITAEVRWQRQRIAWRRIGPPYPRSERVATRCESS